MGGARAVGGMEWEAGIGSGVTVVTFGMCENSGLEFENLKTILS